MAKVGKAKLMQKKEREMRAKLMQKKEGGEKAKEKGKMETKGSWFNIIICFVLFFVVLIMFGGIAYEYLTVESWRFDDANMMYLAAGLHILYTIVFCAILGTGFVFNLISKCLKGLPKDSIWSKIDSFLDSMLWNLIWLFVVGGFVMHVLVVELIVEGW
ncbi:MAG: hypothetical protein ABIH83_02940 [Candidatus Micrarchaeota archaeon]